MVSTFREEENLFEELDSTTTGINFFNLLHESEEYNYMHYYYLYIGSGVAVGDINNDGLQDIFFNGIMTPNRLYLNKQGQFSVSGHFITGRHHRRNWHQDWCDDG